MASETPKTFESTKFGALQKLTRGSILYSRVLAKVKCLPSIHQNGGSNTKFSKTIKCQKWGETLYQNMSFEEILRITLVLQNY